MYEYNQPTLWHRTGAPARVAAAVDSRLAVHGLASVAAAEHATVPAVNPRRLLTESRCHRSASLHRRCDWTRDEMLELRRRRYDCRRIRDARATGRHDWSCDAKTRAPLLQRILPPRHHDWTRDKNRRRRCPHDWNHDVSRVHDWSRGCHDWNPVCGSDEDEDWPRRREGDHRARAAVSPGWAKRWDRATARRLCLLPLDRHRPPSLEGWWLASRTAHKEFIRF